MTSVITARGLQRELRDKARIFTVSMYKIRIDNNFIDKWSTKRKDFFSNLAYLLKTGAKSEEEVEHRGEPSHRRKMYWAEKKNILNITMLLNKYRMFMANNELVMNIQSHMKTHTGILVSRRLQYLIRYGEVIDKTRKTIDTYTAFLNNVNQYWHADNARVVQRSLLVGVFAVLVTIQVNNNYIGKIIQGIKQWWFCLWG